MIIPGGPAWQEIRTQALEAIPIGSIASSRRLRPLREWLGQNYFVVTAATKASFELEVDINDFAGALFDDADRLLNHSTEHQFEVFDRLNREEWTSAAWLIVTCYYWAFFSVQAFSRLTARSLVWFLSKEATAHITSMCMSTSPVNPGAGAYVLGTTPATALNKRQVTLTKTSGRLHDAVWKQFFKYCESVLTFADATNSPIEYRLISVLARSSKELGPDWPSKLRNAVNYQAGLCYKLKNVAGPTILSRRGIYKGRYSIVEIIDLMENTLAHLAGEKDVIKDLENYGTLLICCSYLCFALVDDLFFDVFERHDSKRTNGISKHSFRSSMGLVEARNGMIWPFKK